MSIRVGLVRSPVFPFTAFHQCRSLQHLAINQSIHHRKNRLFLGSSKKQTNCVDKVWAKKHFQMPKVMSCVVSVPPVGYRANVGVCLVNQKNEVFVASRLDVPGSWQMPQGGVDKGEEPRDAAIRELREETGVTSAKIIGEVPEWLTYDFPPDVKAKITRLWGKEWNGQAQKWFLLRFLGDESEINLAGDGTEAAEFEEWKWLSVEEVIKGAVEFKKPVYEKVFEVFTPMLEREEEN